MTSAVPMEELCVLALQARVQTLPEFVNSCVPVLDDEDLYARMANTPRPWCGIAYEGLIAAPEQGASHKAGISTHMQFSLIFTIDSMLPGMQTGVIPTVRQLVKVRHQILDQRGPTGHFWQFIAEVPIGNKKSKDIGTYAVWLQRWSLPLQQAPTLARDVNARFGAPST